MVAALKEPVPVPSRTATVLKFATARSGLPSPLRSPIATENGFEPTAKSVFAPKEPTPVPRRTETFLLWKFATAKSGSPSPFRSPIATENGVVPTTKLVAAPKVTV